MRSIIHGLPPRSGDRIFPKTEQVFGLATSPPIFFGGVPQPNTAQLARFDWAQSSNPLSLAVSCGGVSPCNPLGWCELRSLRVLAECNRVSWGGCWSADFCRERRTPAELGGRVSAGVVAARWRVGVSRWLVVLCRWRRRRVGRRRRTLGVVLRIRLEPTCPRLLRCLV